MRLTPELEALIVAHIRAGSFPLVAAESAGVSRRQFQRWLRRGRTRPQGPYRRFWQQVRQAQAQARAKAEIDARNKDVKFWLRYGPGQTAPPWTAAKRRVRRANPDNSATALLQVLGQLAQLLEPFPEARLVLTQFLTASDRQQAAPAAKRR